jgi:hypothetical protein
MVGQGSPHSVSVFSARWMLHRMCTFLRQLPWCVLLCALCPAVPASAEALDLHLRVAWGGGPAQQWQGSLAAQFGTLSRLSYLGLDADEAACIYLDQNSVHIDQQSARDYDGFDIRVSGSSQTVLTLEIAPLAGSPERKGIEIPLDELVAGYRSEPLDDKGNFVVVQRMSGDNLRIRFDRSSLVFAPGETFEFEVVPHHTALEDLSNLRCHTQLLGTGDDQLLWQQSDELQLDPDGNLKPVGPIALPVPETEGVYQVSISVHRKRFRDTFVRSKPLLQRKMQVVVVDDAVPERPERPWELIDTIEPHHASWMEWLSRVPRLPLLPEFRQEPLGNEKSQDREHAGKQFVELAPGGWLAYPTPIAVTGQPHMLEVEYPGDIAQTLGISIWEPNAAGKLVPLGLDSGVDVTREAAENQSGVQRHRLLFWPRTSAPLVLLTNRREDQPAVFGKIRILAGPKTLPGGDPTTQPRLTSPRLIAAYFDRPLFPENFTAPEAADMTSGRSLKDWLTFYEGGRRLVDYLKDVGYNGAIISVACHGGTIYPSDLLKPIPKYDTGTFFTFGQDPVPKDVLEMLLRLFDREGLTLIPAVQFSSTLEELERQLRSDPERSMGIRLVDRQGKSWRETYTASQGMAPHYNPLDPRVQGAMRRVLNEISDRYGNHRSFGGLALQLGPESYALLPGINWGCDPATCQRFQQATGIPAPSGDERHSNASLMLDHQKSWLTWRAEALAKFYESILADLRSRRPDGRLYLATADIFTDRRLQPLLQPTIPNRLQLEEALLRMGIVTDHFANQQDIVFFRPERKVAGAPLTQQAVNLNLATNTAADNTFSQITPAASLFYHERLPLALPSFDAQSPFGKDNTRMRLFAHISPSASSNRRRYVHHLAMRDVQFFADGGWMLPLGQEDALRDLFATLAQLPARPFETVKSNVTTLPTQPLVVRSLSHDGKTYIYVVNDSPWAISAEVDIQSQVRCELQPLSHHQLIEPTWLEDQMTWPLDLQPFDVVAVVLPHQAAQVRSWRRVSVERSTYAVLRRQVHELEQKVRSVKLNQPDPIDVLANAGFESSPDRLPGWIHAQGVGLTIGPDADLQSEGQQSLQLASNGPVAWIRSDPFDPPKSGRIAIVVRLRTDDPKNQPPLRLAVEGKYLDGVTYYEPRNVGLNSKTPISARWTPYLLSINDLPTNQLANVRVGFDLMGAGRVWIDDVRVYDTWFLKHEQDDLMIMHGLAVRSLTTGRVADCRRILNSYWSRFLVEHVSAEAARVAELPAPAPQNGGAAFPPPQADAEEPAKSSMLDKVRQRLPSKVFPFRLR